MKTTQQITKLINDYWKFDNNQQPKSSWHDKQDLLEAIADKPLVHRKVDMSKVTSENYQKSNLVTDEIEKHLKAVKRDTAGFSTHYHIFEHESYKHLVSMGDKIIPYLFKLITQQTGGDWIYFFLLGELTKRNPVPEVYIGSFDHHLFYWLHWWLESDYRKNSDIYYGLAN